ncbi:hypothetical protein Poli38472_009991 [Pythium oligandrum]|uniref:Uncharacterized protein n=1 Tax=Pythium oligandrum TaxID=41045 RepID=A0A8K1C8C3_PYTOL|nr:hypothetical protein Poli38472_009991 [Pythium oligandrum]|eukprot:TMW58432.1 hypothetical protein Poli38472_009991 [Pythium oligandrum]
MRCRGWSKSTNKRCNNRQGVSALGYCNFHKPEALRCRGWATTTNQRCRVKKGLDANFMCEHHKDQLVRCHAVLPLGGRCKSVNDIDRYGYCTRHSAPVQEVKSSEEEEEETDDEEQREEKTK